jgi:MFS family permease
MLLAAGLAGVALLGTWGSTQWAPNLADELTAGKSHSREYTQIWLAIGACVGTIAAALVGDWLGRRVTYFILCVGSLVSALWLFVMNHSYGTSFLVSSFVAGAFTASFYGWLPLYLPELFATNVRATGQGFGFNFGRILAAIGALQAGVLTGMFPHDQVLLGMTVKGGLPLACSAMSLIYLVGMAFIWLAPETKGKPLPD